MHSGVMYSRGTVQYRFLRMHSEVTAAVDRALDRWCAMRLAEANVIALAGRPAASTYFPDVARQYDRMLELLQAPFQVQEAGKLKASDEDGRKYIGLLQGGFRGFGEVLDAMRIVNDQVKEAKHNADTR